MDSIYQKIKTDLINLKIKNCSILIALSGGKDSMTLLSLLLELKKEFNLKLFVSYINHNLRGDESKKEDDFVTYFTKKINIPLFKYIVPVDFWKKLRNQSTEMAARKIRYDFFNKIIDENKIDYIATAHNLNDKIETFFLQLFRGGGFNSLSSIPLKNKKVIRPLLNITRKEIDDYINNKNIPFIHDFTNDENIYKRNIVRNKLLPVFKKIHPDYEKSFMHVFNFINEELSFLKSSSIKHLKKIIIYKSNNKIILNKNKYSKLPIALQKNIIKIILKQLNHPALPDSILLNKLSGNKNNYIYSKNNLVVKACKNHLWFINQMILKSFNENIKVIKLPFNYNNDHLSISIHKTANINPKKNFYFKYDKSLFPLIIRGLKKDDELSINAKNKINIKKILKNNGIIEQTHKETLVIESNNKEIIGFKVNNYCRISKAFYVEDNNKKNILIKISF